LLVGGGLVLAGNLLVEVRGIKESGV
jgi:hypothetical protein